MANNYGQLENGNQLEITSQYAYTTIRIECQDENGIYSFGTGFFFSFFENELENYAVISIITNRHVIEGFRKARFIFTISKPDGTPYDTDHYCLEIDNIQNRCLYHPDPRIDLCAIPFADFLKILKNKGIKPFFKTIDKSMIVCQDEKLSPLEEIIMVGYPNAIIDEINNQPIIRKGMTATNPNKNFNGKKEFLIDMACFPGSSGSPIFIYNNQCIINNMKFLGIVKATPLHKESFPVLDSSNNLTNYKSIIRIPNDLGIVIKAQELFGFEQPIAEIVINSGLNFKKGSIWHK